MADAIKLQTPLTQEVVRSLKQGDNVEVSGLMVTGRDALHKLWINSWPTYDDVDLRGAVLYHCGPVMRQNKKDGTWSVLAAGPTTSIREEPYQAAVIGKYGFGGVVGKGGMGPKTLAGLKEHGAVYLHAVGGAAQVLARKVVKVVGVKHLDLGVPEAMWILEVKDFPCLVTMDSHGESLHAAIQKSSKEVLDRLVAK